MSIESEIVSALSGVAGGRVYPQVAPEKALKPFVIYKAKSEPITALSGALLGYRTPVVFECWAATYASAMATATALTAAFTASALSFSTAEPPDDGYDPEVDEFVRPLAFEFVSAP